MYVPTVNLYLALEQKTSRDAVLFGSAICSGFRVSARPTYIIIYSETCTVSRVVVVAAAVVGR